MLSTVVVQPPLAVSRAVLVRWIRAAGIAVVLCLMALPSRAQETVCAVVKIEIRQELTLERQAFEARMKVTNGLDTLALENVHVNVLFEDAAGEAVIASSDPNNAEARFFIRLDAMTGVSDVSGSGTIPPKGVAEVTWLIIPAPGAGGTLSAGELYRIGATLSYQFGGEDQVVTVDPDIIRVKPMPELRLDYFLPHEVFGDDPLTSDAEVTEPFDLGVRVTNAGYGPAHQLRIESAQPRITENNQGLLVNFELLGSSVDDQPSANTLLVDFGTIEPETARIARWLMSSSLTGKFISFEAEFVHADELGGALTSLIDSVNTHTLVHSVRSDLPGRDAISDFLARDGSVLRLYESDGVDADVVDLSAGATLQQLAATGTAPRFRLVTATAVTPVFARVADPYPGVTGEFAALRSDGKRLHQTNVWRYRESIAPGEYRHYLGLFDTGSTGSYELAFSGEVQSNRPPVLDPIQDVQVMAGQPVAVSITASDPDGDAVQLSAPGLPQGAILSDFGDGTGRIDWVPSLEQVGTAQVTIVVSDGSASASTQFHVAVAMPPDSDDDGMLDAWEREHFENLDRDGTGDYDRDSASDIAEFEHGGNPTVEDRPGAPGILSPAPGTLVQQSPVEMVLANASRAADAAASYRVEVFRDGPAPGAPLVALADEQPLETAIVLESALEENAAYFWRVGAHDGATPGNWAYSGFRYSAADEQPGHCAIASPAPEATADPRPRLAARIDGDPEGDTLGFLIRVFADSGLVVPVTESPRLPVSADGHGLEWQVYPPLEGGSEYYWQASVLDQDGNVLLDCPVGTFTVAADALPLSAPMLEITAQSAATATIRVRDPVPGRAVEATVQLDDTATFDGPGLRSGTFALTLDGSAEWAVDGLSAATTYFVRARLDLTGEHGNWTHGELQLAAEPTLASPLALGPRDGTWVTTRQPRLSVLEPASGVESSYQFQLATDAGFVDLLADEAGGPVHTVGVALTDREWYWWRARAVRDGVASGPWLAAQRFFVIEDGFDTPPDFDWVGLDVDRDARPGLFTLEWQALDPDSNAVIDLAAIPDSDPQAVITVAQGLSEDGDRRFSWDMSAIPDGVYVLQARIHDATTAHVVEATGAIHLRTPAVRLTPGGLVTSEDGATAELSVVLAAPPVHAVVVPLATSAPAEASLSPSFITFGPYDWAIPKTVTLTGVDDDLADGDRAYEVQFGPLVSDDPAYAGVVGATSGFANHDNDAVGFELELEADPLVTGEDGSSARVGVSLASRPYSSVAVELHSSNDAEAQVSPSRLVISPDTWNVPQWTNVTGVDDGIVDGDATFGIAIALVESDDPAYIEAARPSLQGTNRDDDIPTIDVSPRDGLVVDEGGASVTLSVAINAQPTADVRLPAVSLDAGEGVLSPTELVFTAANWREPQSVRLTGVADGEADGDQSFELRIGPASTTDTRFSVLPAADLRATNLNVRSPRMEVGTVDVQDWAPGETRRIAHGIIFETAPLVFPTLVTQAGAAAVLRIAAVERGHFDVVLVAPSGQDPGPVTGTLSFVAVEEGVHFLPDGRRVVATQLSTSGTYPGDGWNTLAFAVPFRRTPSVLTQLQASGSSAQWATTVVGGITAEAVEVAVERQSPLTGQQERVAVLAIDAGAQGRFEAQGRSITYTTQRARHEDDGDRCKPALLPWAAAEAPIALVALNSRSGAGQRVARLCDVSPSVAWLDLEPIEAGLGAAEEALSVLTFSAPFVLVLDASSAGLLIEQLFGQRTYEDSPGTAFGVRLSRQPAGHVEVSLGSPAAALHIQPARLSFDAINWADPQWVRVNVAGELTDGNVSIPVRLESASAEDVVFDALPDSTVNIAVHDRSAAHRVIDNSAAGFLPVGVWSSQSILPGHLGQDYLTHVANGESPDSIFADNDVSGFELTGEWALSVDGADAFGSNYRFRAPGDPPSTVVLDDTDALLGSGWHFSDNGTEHHGAGYHWASRGGTRVATWSLTSIPAGEYRVYTRWVAHRNRAPDAPYEIVHAAGTTTVRVDQSSGGGIWQALGTFTLDGQSRITLSNDAAGHVVADAIRLIPVGAEPNTASWSVPLPSSGRYEVYARWPAHAEAASDAPFRVQHSDGTATVRVDQAGGAQGWVLLGAWTFDAATEALVRLGDDANGIVLADAVKLVPETARPNSGTWTFSGLPLGEWDMEALWVSAPAHASNAPFSVDALGARSLRLNDQRVHGGRWEALGAAATAPELDIAVQLTDRADGTVVADAIRARDRRSAGPLGSRWFGANKAEVVGDWTWTSSTTVHGEGTHLAAPGDGTARLRWQLAVPTDTYRVYVRWESVEAAAGNAPYRVHHASSEDLVRLDQRVGSGQWLLLGTFALDAASYVELSNDADGWVSGGAVRIEPARYPEPTQ